MDNPSSELWSVEVTSSGRAGTVVYREPAGSVSFYWEFGGDDAVAILWIENAAAWKTRHPWAVDRRRAILERVAQEVVRQQAPTCRVDIDDASGFIYIRKPA